MRAIARRIALIMPLVFAAACGSEETDVATEEQAVSGTNPVRHAGSGTWIPALPPGATPKDPAHEIVRGWVDAQVLNARFNKRVLVEVSVPYENGTEVRTLAPAWYKSSRGDGTEIWGTDALEIYPLGGPHGARMAAPAVFRVRMQHDVNGDGQDEMYVTAWARLHGEGELRLPENDPWAPGWRSPRRAPMGQPQGPQLFFSPFDDPGAKVVAEIDAVIAAQQADPSGRHTVHAAVFNINDERIVNALVRAHQAGVEVRLVTEGHKLRPEQTWQTSDDVLLAAGVPLLGVMRPGRGAMHDKLALFDGRKVETGSYNWEHSSSFETHENLLLLEDPDALTAYAERFEVLAGEVQRSRTAAGDPNGRLYAGFGPDEPSYREVGTLIDSAQRTLHIAMFTAKDVEYQENGVQTSLLRKVIAAHQRGVKVHFMTDRDIAEASEYYGVMSSDDQTDEWLETNGIHVIHGNPSFAQYSSMHHKFMVVDEAVAVTGALNWYYDAAYLNDEDIIVVRDPAIAARLVGEFTDLARRYDPLFDATAWPQVKVDLQLHCDRTGGGDQLQVLGDLPEFGAWTLGEGLVLDGTEWPFWKSSVTLPAGVRVEYKYVLRRADGAATWEQGANRRYTVPVGVSEARLEEGFRW